MYTCLIIYETYVTLHTKIKASVKFAQNHYCYYFYSVATLSFEKVAKHLLD